MPNVANAAQFSEPQARLIAGGFDVKRWLNDDQGVGTGGIVSPQRIHLRGRAAAGQPLPNR